MNMRGLMDERVARMEQATDTKSAGQNLGKIERMKSRVCEFVSLHAQVEDFDREQHGEIPEMERIDIEQEKFMKLKTVYKSYAEIKLCSKISTTNWDDALNIRWEAL